MVTVVDSVPGLVTNRANKMEETPGLVEHSGERWHLCSQLPDWWGTVSWGGDSQPERMQRNQGPLVAPLLGLIISQLTDILVLFLWF